MPMRESYEPHSLTFIACSSIPWYFVGHRQQSRCVILDQWRAKVRTLIGPLIASTQANADIERSIVMRKTLTAASIALFLALCGCGGGSFAAPVISRDHPQPLANVPTQRPVTVTRESGGPDFCTGGILDQGAPLGQPGPDLVIYNTTCTVDGSAPNHQYNFHNVYILGTGGLSGTLAFNNVTQDFYAENILVQNGGVLQASGIGAGNDGQVLRIHLYGGVSDPGVVCQKVENGVASNDTTCGIPSSVFLNQMSMDYPTSCTSSALPGNVNDCFYQYDVFDSGDVQGAYFGHKVLALSYGGTINLSGYKGAQGGDDNDPSVNSSSWMRLNATLKGGGTETALQVSGMPADWTPNEPNEDINIVVTSTDYLPGHAEQMKVASVDGSTINLKSAVENPHWGQTYPLSTVPCNAPEGSTDCQIGPALLTPNENPADRSVDVRAAVGLLSRSVRIISDGASPGLPLPTTGPAAYFGGHTVVRQGFQSYQVQGVEFYQLGQGGSKGHYPVHFHMARQTPADTYVKDSSAWDSMTRWYTIHATQGVTLARNVGYKSIGHGYYLEDGTETDNHLNTNLGVFARAAVTNPQNDRNVPGILAAPPVNVVDPSQPIDSDWQSPTLFWIMNSWNDFQYNYASSATTCGVCYWELPGAISGPSRKEYFTGYAAEQLATTGWTGTTPLKSFVGNSCSSAMFAYLNIGPNAAGCPGVTNTGATQALQAVPNLTAPAQQNPPISDPNYPYTQGLRDPTQCPGGVCPTIPCGNRALPSEPYQLENCVVTTLDRFTSSFTWAPKNFSAIWLRRWWFLVENSAITDVQQGGITFVTGGGYTRSELAQGYWSLMRTSALVGNTQATNGQPANAWAWSAGPFNPTTHLTCDYQRGDYCLSAANGITYLIDSNQANQRLINIYDGPSHEERNAFLDIPTTQIGAAANCSTSGNGFERTCPSFGYLYGVESGVPQDTNGNCYLPNAAIAWKQSNGFYYPPAFHSDQLFFQNVDIRHFVIEPLFDSSGTFTTDPTLIKNRYCTWTTALFNNFTDIDRQTVLNDDDGSLTGLLADLGGGTTRETISVNRPYAQQAGFYNDPKVTAQCASDLHPAGTPATCPPGTADTSPNEYVTTGMIAKCGINGVIGGGCRQGGFPQGVDCADSRYFRPPNSYCAWGNSCSSGSGGAACYGVPVYREYLTSQEYTQYQRSPSTFKNPTIRMMGQGNGQRSTLTVNHGLYYIDDQVPLNAQWKPGDGVTNTMFNIFFPNETYYVYFVYAKASLDQNYQMFVGYGLDKQTVIDSVKPYRALFPSDAFEFQSTSGASFLDVNYDDKPKTMGGTGLVTIHVHLNAYADEFEGDKPQFCQPVTYCQANGNDQCKCAPGSSCTDDSVCSWAIKDMDCPIAGCFAFGITLPQTFQTGTAPDPRPVPTKFPSQNWNTPFDLVDQTITGEQCHYTEQPPTLCPVH
jgi:hypothetical protein